MAYSYPDEDRDYLTEKMAICGELAAGMAHEIRNPLTSVRGFLQLLQNKFDPESAEQEYFTIMLSELERINNIIKEFLTLSKPSEPQLKITSFSQLLNECLLLIEQEAIMNEVRLTHYIPEELPLLCLDSGQIKQVILNITSNAIHAAGSGGQVIIRSYLEGEEVVTTIEDNGSGISKEQQQLIFEPFYTTKKDGTGLGLTLSKRIIESHGGTISFTTEIGKGSKFKITLPKS
ncbi:MAG: two-component system, NtrC family, sensor histidine kinase HydH [Clostridia bacterium]|nr:two-component system, NtrC family, sensor histidine kinase HydH [Clostridia bacterium]